MLTHAIVYRELYVQTPQRVDRSAQDSGGTIPCRNRDSIEPGGFPVGLSTDGAIPDPVNGEQTFQVFLWPNSFRGKGSYEFCTGERE